MTRVLRFLGAVAEVLHAYETAERLYLLAEDAEDDLTTGAEAPEDPSIIVRTPTGTYAGPRSMVLRLLEIDADERDSGNRERVSGRETRSSTSGASAT